MSSTSAELASASSALGAQRAGLDRPGSLPRVVLGLAIVVGLGCSPEVQEGMSSYAS